MLWGSPVSYGTYCTDVHGYTELNILRISSPFFFHSEWVGNGVTYESTQRDISFLDSRDFAPTLFSFSLSLSAIVSCGNLSQFYGCKNVSFSQNLQLLWDSKSEKKHQWNVFLSGAPVIPVPFLSHVNTHFYLHHQWSLAKSLGHPPHLTCTYERSYPPLLVVNGSFPPLLNVERAQHSACISTPFPWIEGEKWFVQLQIHFPSIFSSLSGP